MNYYLIFIYKIIEQFNNLTIEQFNNLTI